MTPEQISSFKMSYPCGYEYLLGQQQPLHNIQLIYPAAAAAAGEDKTFVARKQLEKLTMIAQ